MFLGWGSLLETSSVGLKEWPFMQSYLLNMDTHMKIKQETRTQIIKRQSKIKPCCEETEYLRKEVLRLLKRCKEYRELTGNLLARIHDAEHVMSLPQGQGGVSDCSVPFLMYNLRWHPSKNMVVNTNATKT
jgi:hypothetical protein